MKGKLTSDIVFLSVGTLNRKLLHAVLSKNPHVIHLTLDFNYPCQNIFKGSVFMFLFKNAFIQACFEDSSFPPCFSTPFLLSWSKNHQRLVRQNLGVLWLFQWGRWILFFKVQVKKSILQFLVCYWSQYLYLSLPVVSFQECHVPSFFSLQFYYYFELVPAAIVSSRKSLKNL